MKTSITQILIVCHLLPFAKVGQYITINYAWDKLLLKSRSIPFFFLHLTSLFGKHNDGLRIIFRNTNIMGVVHLWAIVIQLTKGAFMLNF